MTEKYEEILNGIELFLSEYNPCQFVKGECIAVRKGKRLNTCCVHTTTYIKCDHLSSTGCTTVNIACKMFLCKYAGQTLSESAYDELNRLRVKYDRNFDCLPYRMHKDEVYEMLFM